jgi:hypothetical protein
MHNTPTAPPDILPAVVAKLAALGVTATVEYPGFIAVRISPEAAWNFGTANPTWGGDLTTDWGRALDACDFGIPRTSTDVDTLADRIAAVVR